jgi:poly(A) polymerase
MTEREFAWSVVQNLQANGYQALWAGGCVRDELLGVPPADYDVATDARPEQVMAVFRRCIEVGVAFGVVEVLGPRDACGDGSRCKLPHSAMMGIIVMVVGLIL